MLMPVAKQYTQMKLAGVIPPGRDMLYFLYAAQDSPHSLQEDGGPSVSMFGFDFTSKSYKRIPEDYVGPPRLFTKRNQDYFEDDLSWLMRDLLAIKQNYEEPQYYEDEQSYEEDKTFIKNVSEKCANAIRNALDDDYIERLARKEAEELEKQKKQLREFESKHERLVESILEDMKKRQIPLERVVESFLEDVKNERIPGVELVKKNEKLELENEQEKKPEKPKYEITDLSAFPNFNPEQQKNGSKVISYLAENVRDITKTILLLCLYAFMISTLYSETLN